MKRIVALLCCIGCLGELLSLDTKPWLGNVWEWEFESAFTYCRFHDVQGASVQFKNPFNGRFLRGDLGFTLTERWDVQVEIECADTSVQSFGYRSAAAQTRLLLRNDIAGDPLSWTLGLNMREVGSASLKDVSCPYHATGNIELHTAFGKEWSQEGIWTMRTYGFVGLGMANRGSPWIRALGSWEGDWGDAHRLHLFMEGYFGCGDKQQVDVYHFHGWGKYQHRSIDIGAAYAYHFQEWGCLGVQYAYRLFAHTFPENVQFFTLFYRLPFSLF